MVRLKRIWVRLADMTIRLLPGAATEDALQKLLGLRSELTRLGSGTDQESFIGYGRWALDSARMVAHCLPVEVIDQLIFTRRYWAIQDVGGSMLWDTHPKPQLRLLISAEIDQRGRELEVISEQLRLELFSWNDCGHLVVPDTSVFLQHLQKFDLISWIDVAQAKSLEVATVVVPMAVIRELDAKKRQSGTIRWRAAYSLSKIEDLFGNTPVAGRAPVLAPADTSPAVMVADTGRGEVRIRVLVDDLGQVRLPNPDDEIITKALDVKSWSGRRVRLATFDTNMAFQARQAGLDVTKLSRKDLAEEFRPKPPKGERENFGDS